MSHFSRSHRWGFLRWVLVGMTVIVVLVLVLSACTTGTKEEEQRKQEQETSSAGSETNTLEKQNLEEKRKREENPNALRYVYLMSYGKIIGYYTAKGKISSNGSQKGPEQSVLWTCRKGDCAPVVVDSKQDDGTYGAGDPGIFFFTTEGAKVVTNLDYIESDQLIAVNVPKLN